MKGEFRLGVANSGKMTRFWDGSERCSKMILSKYFGVNPLLCGLSLWRCFDTLAAVENSCGWMNAMLGERLRKRDLTRSVAQVHPKEAWMGTEQLSSESVGLSRPGVQDLDAVLGQRFPVLDQGFVRLIDYMGDDSAVVQAARVSYGIGTKRVREDRGLIRYLLRHSHTTPFEMCEIKLHIRVPMDVWRQWIRHRTANVNEYSTRYSVAIDAAQQTAANAWRYQSSANRQGSNGILPLEVGSRLSSVERDLHDKARAVYEARISAGVAREQARKDLPLSTYTEAYWKIDLHNLLHFLHVRMNDQAQQEIRAYASFIGENIVAKWVPLVWEAFLDYRRDAMQLSRIEIAIIKALQAGDAETASRMANETGLLQTRSDGRIVRNRERNELEAKLRGLGLALPWDSEDAD